MRKVQPHQAGIIARMIIDLRIKPNASYWACFLTVLSDVCKKNLSVFCKHLYLIPRSQEPISTYPSSNN